MSQIQFEQAVSAVRALTPAELKRLREFIAEEEDAEKKQRAEAARAAVRAASLRDFTADRQWLADHRNEYAGQWVALWYGQLIKNSTNAKEVFAAARNSGHEDALVVLVEPPLEPGHAFINIG